MSSKVVDGRTLRSIERKLTNCLSDMLTGCTVYTRVNNKYDEVVKWTITDVTPVKYEEYADLYNCQVKLTDEKYVSGYINLYQLIAHTRHYSENLFFRLSVSNPDVNSELVLTDDDNLLKLREVYMSFDKPRKRPFSNWLVTNYMPENICKEIELQSMNLKTFSKDKSKYQGQYVDDHLDIETWLKKHIISIGGNVPDKRDYINSFKRLFGENNLSKVNITTPKQWKFAFYVVFDCYIKEIPFKEIREMVNHDNNIPDPDKKRLNNTSFVYNLYKHHDFDFGKNPFHGKEDI